jgi:hypothetical protein
VILFNGGWSPCKGNILARGVLLRRSSLLLKFVTSISQVPLHHKGTFLPYIIILAWPAKKDLQLSIRSPKNKAVILNRLSRRKSTP